MVVKNALSALQVMQDAPVIPVIVLNDVAHAVPMARALVAGGVRMLEVTLRTPVALACSFSGSRLPATFSASGITLYGNSAASSKGGRPRSERGGV